MVSLPMPDKRAAILGEDVAYFLLVLSHYTIILSLRSERNVSEIGLASE